MKIVVYGGSGVERGTIATGKDGFAFTGDIADMQNTLDHFKRTAAALLAEEQGHKPGTAEGYKALDELRPPDDERILKFMVHASDLIGKTVEGKPRIQEVLDDQES